MTDHYSGNDPGTGCFYIFVAGAVAWVALCYFLWGWRMAVFMSVVLAVIFWMLIHEDDGMNQP